MAVPPRTTKCEICGTSTHASFGTSGNLHYYCEEHKDAVHKGDWESAQESTETREIVSVVSTMRISCY
jgi:hypothetical protein